MSSKCDYWQLEQKFRFAIKLLSFSYLTEIYEQDALLKCTRYSLVLYDASYSSSKATTIKHKMFSPFAFLLCLHYKYRANMTEVTYLLPNVSLMPI